MRNMWSEYKNKHYFSEQYPHKRLYRYHQTLSVHGQLIFSMIASCLALIGAAYWLQGESIESYKTTIIINFLTIYITYQIFGVYHQSSGILMGRRRSFLFGLWVLSKAWFIVIMAMVFLYFSSGFQLNSKS